jgi:hypothetical protein
MKNKIYTLIIAAALMTTAKAQQFNIKAGLNVYSMLVELSDKTPFELKSTNLMGIHAGGSFDYFLNDRLSVEMGLLYMQKGYSGSDEFEIDPILLPGIKGTVNFDFRLHYLDIPLQMKYRFGNRDVRFYVAAGPYIGIGLDGTIKFEAKSNFPGMEPEANEESIKWGDDPNNDMLKRLEFGVCGGGGIEYNNFLLGINYAYGLNNISSSSTEGTLKNRVFGISLGYIINKQ